MERVRERAKLELKKWVTYCRGCTRRVLGLSYRGNGKLGLNQTGSFQERWMATGNGVEWERS